MRRETATMNKTAVCKQAVCSLLMLSAGLLFCSLLAWLAYFSYQSAAGNVVFCSPFTDIPGRLAILASSYYVAGMCGYCPLPGSYRSNWLHAPFTFWRLRSWYDLINSCLPRPSADMIRRFRRNAMRLRGSPELPLFREEQSFYDGVPIVRRRSAPVRIVPPRFYVRPVYEKLSVDTKAIADAQTPDDSSGSGESFMSFDSPLGGHIVPMVKGKSLKPPYLPDSVQSEKESSKHPVKVSDRDRATRVLAEGHESDKSPRLTESEMNDSRRDGSSNASEAGIDMEKSGGLPS